MSSELSAKPQPAEVNAMSVQSISSCYDAAETAIKQAEVLCQHQPIPALNEMRYAGYHALRYAELPAGDERDEERRKCVRHARRAYYDANEFMILGLCGEADAIDRKIRGYEHIVSEIMGHQSFSQFSGQLIAAREFAMESRLRQKDAEKLRFVFLGLPFASSRLGNSVNEFGGEPKNGRIGKSLPTNAPSTQRTSGLSCKPLMRTKLPSSPGFLPRRRTAATHGWLPLEVPSWAGWPS